MPTNPEPADAAGAVAPGGSTGVALVPYRRPAPPHSGIGLLKRTLGLATAIALALSPWCITFGSFDPYLNQGWVVLGLGFLNLVAVVLFLPWLAPSQRQLPWIPAVAVVWAGLVVSTLHSSYLASMRLAMVAAGQLLVFAGIRLFLRREDCRAVLVTLVGSGTGLALYGLAQKAGFDLFRWHDVLPGLEVMATLGNPNHLGAYLMATSLIAFVLWRDGFAPTRPGRLALLTCIAIQITCLVFTYSLASRLGIGIGLVLYFWRFWERQSGSWFRWRPLAAALPVTLIIVVGHTLLARLTATYPWQDLVAAPYAWFTATTRCQLWLIGMQLFEQSPFTGIGLGATPYLVAQVRHPAWAFLGLSSCSDDVHAIQLTALSELGLLGLYGLVAVILAFVAVHRWKVAQDDSDQTVTRATFVGLLVLLAHGAYNNSLTTLPLANLAVLLAAVHQTWALQSCRWRPRWRLFAIVYLVLPIAFAVGAMLLQRAYQTEQQAIFSGQKALLAGDLPTAVQRFEAAIAANGQSLLGYVGLTNCLEQLGEPRQALAILSRLDHLAPGYMNSRYRMAQLHLATGRLLEAHRWAVRHLESSLMPTAFQLVAAILEREGRDHEAITLLEKGLRQRLDHLPLEHEATRSMQQRLGQYYLEQGRLTQAEDLLASAAITAPAPTTDNLYSRGILRYRQGLATEAIRLLQQALLTASDSPQIQNALGYLLIERGDLRAAEPLLLAAYNQLKQQPSPPLADLLDVTHSLGVLYWRLNETPRARDLLALAYQQTPLDWRQAKSSRAADLKRLLRAINDRERFASVFPGEPFVAASDSVTLEP